MRYRLLLPLAVLLAAFLVAPAAQAKPRIGLSEQSPNLFSQPSWAKLKLKRVRYIVSWDYAKQGFERAEVSWKANVVSTGFGTVSIEDFVRFSALHTRHHCKQIPGAA